MEIGPFDIQAVEEAIKVYKINKKHATRILVITVGVPDYVIKVLKNIKEGERRCCI